MLHTFFGYALILPLVKYAVHEDRYFSYIFQFPKMSVRYRRVKTLVGAGEVVQHEGHLLVHALLGSNPQHSKWFPEHNLNAHKRVNPENHYVWLPNKKRQPLLDNAYFNRISEQ